MEEMKPKMMALVNSVSGKGQFPCSCDFRGYQGEGKYSEELL